jgi:hypothetical protein
VVNGTIWSIQIRGNVKASDSKWRRKDDGSAQVTGTKFLKIFINYNKASLFCTNKRYHTPGTRSRGGGIKMRTHFYGARGSSVNK